MSFGEIVNNLSPPTSKAAVPRAVYSLDSQRLDRKKTLQNILTENVTEYFTTFYFFPGDFLCFINHGKCHFEHFSKYLFKFLCPEITVRKIKKYINERNNKKSQ